LMAISSAAAVWMPVLPERAVGCRP
jgi:hypothetical protein